MRILDPEPLSQIEQHDPVADAAAGVILGAFQGIRLEAREAELAPGDTVVLYTDGVTEARDPEGQLFGEERLATAATAARGNAEAVMESITSAVATFTGVPPRPMT